MTTDPDHAGKHRAADEGGGKTAARSGVRLTSEMVVAVSAVVVGACALGVSIYEASLMRQEQRAATMLVLEVSRSVYLYGNDMDSSDTRVNLQVENVGIGPARVQDFRVYVDGEPHTTWRAALESLLGPRDGIRLSQSTINGRTIPAERRITIFSLESMEHAAELAAALPRLEMQACYCSIFDECWTAEYDALGITEPVDTCVRSDASFQQ